MARQVKSDVENAPVPAPACPSLFDQVAGYLDTNDWKYTGDREKGGFSLWCRVKDASVRVILDLYEADGAACWSGRPSRYSCRSTVGRLLRSV